MDAFGVISLAWLASAVLATFVGYLHGRSGDGMSLGVLLGPLGLVLTIVLAGRLRRMEGAVVLKIDAAPRHDHTAPETENSETQLRRAA